MDGVWFELLQFENGDGSPPYQRRFPNTQAVLPVIVLTPSHQQNICSRFVLRAFPGRLN